MTAYRLPLEPGTKVRRKIPRGPDYNLANTGVVQPYDTTTWTGAPITTSVGLFPVRWDNRIWETCTADDVLVQISSASQVDAA